MDQFSIRRVKDQRFSDEICFHVSASLDVMSILDSNQNSVFFWISGFFDEVTTLILNKSDFAGDGNSSEAIRHMVTTSALQFVQDEEFQMFQEFTLQGRDVGTAILNGRTFDELIDLLSKKTKFSKWLNDRQPEEKLVSAWIDHLSDLSWYEKLPVKVARFAAATGSGILLDAKLATMGVPPGVGFAGGLAVGVFDTFVLDGMIQGWKPNQFVSGPLKKFVE